MSLYVLVVDERIVTYPYSLQQMIADNPDVSFSSDISDATAAIYNTYPVIEVPPPSYDPMTQNLTSTNPDLIGGVWVQTWVVEPATPAEIAEREKQAEASNKAQAQSLLSETDWVDIPAVSDPANIPHLENTAEFNTYRLALRAIAVTPPVTVDPWPVKPEEIWVTA